MLPEVYKMGIYGGAFLGCRRQPGAYHKYYLPLRGGVWGEFLLSEHDLRIKR